MLLASPFRTPSTPRKRSNAVRTPTTTPPEEHAHKRHQTPHGVEITATRSGRVIATTKELIDGVVITKSRAVTDNELEIELSQERRTSRSESPTTERKVSEADNTYQMKMERTMQTQLQQVTYQSNRAQFAK